MQGTIITSGRGFWFLVCDGTDETLFLHHTEVVGNRYLRENDRIAFEVAPNPRKPGQRMAVHAQWIGRLIPQDTTTKMGVSR